MKLSEEIAIKENLFTYKNVLYEKLYNFHHKYRFFTDNDTDYDYLECNKLIKELDYYAI